jgi:hypothetical protein
LLSTGAIGVNDGLTTIALCADDRVSDGCPATEPVTLTWSVCPMSVLLRAAQAFAIFAVRAEVADRLW